ncbi:helix-turn-helix transcriptional regulator [Streptosporangium sp. NPDC048047]|uniref:helix-turn-helix transcriptional regulator n=1 Tax=Streptosporangium sp. NPDC048047 TaxID=3155748 RepID=UPI003441E1AE
MGHITRSRRLEIQREAARLRMREQREGSTVERIVTQLCTAIPELSPLEAWRLALGWSRAQAVREIAALYVVDGLRPPGLSPAQLCRFEHGPDRPGPEYTEMLARAYGAHPGQLGLASRCTCGGAPGYGHPEVKARAWPPVLPPGVEIMTASGLSALRESLRLALLDAPNGSLAAADLAQAAVEHYALAYSRHAPATLFDEVAAARGLLTAVLAAPADERTGTELRRAAGWLSALLANLAWHLADHAGARAHLTVAGSLAERVGDARLTAWTLGAQSMVTRRRDAEAALSYAQAGLERAPTPLVRAQLLGWAVLPSLVQTGRRTDAERTLGEAAAALDTAEEEPGRFGFDSAELALHEAEAWLALDHTDRATARAEASAGECVPHTPGWAAATLVLAQAEASTRPGDAASRAVDVLERIPADRLRSTARERLRSLVMSLGATDVAAVRDLRERVRTLPPPTDIRGRDTPA